MNSRVMSNIVILSGAVLLIAYGIVASLYWPITAVSPDVWGEGYAALSSANTQALLASTIIWVVLVLFAVIGAVVWTRNASARAVWSAGLAALGLAAVLLAVPTTFVSVAVYNVIPTTSEYPDQVTPIVLYGGGVLLLCGAVGGILAARSTQRRESARVSPDAQV